MKKNLIKKVFAVSLSIAMACSLLPASKPVTASAAAPYVSLKTTFKTLKVNQNYKMTLKNNSLNWKIKKVTTSDKPIATVHSKKADSVMIKGKSEGRATISISLKTSARKTKNTKTLKCRVKVVANSSSENPTPVQTEAIVGTQAELTEALGNSNITKITIKPSSAVNFVIPEANYSAVDLVVDAPESDIENSATFKSITINNIRPETWTEKGKNNNITLLAKKGSVVVAQGAVLSKLTLGTADAEVNVKLDGGAVAEIAVNAKAKLNLTGKAAEGAALVKITIGTAAADAEVTTAVPAAIETYAKVVLVFESGAEKSTLKISATGISASITNRTKESVAITLNDGTTRTANPGAVNQTVNSVGSAGTTPGGTTVPGGSSVVKPVSANTVTASAFAIDGSVVTYTTGSATTITEGSLRLQLEARAADVVKTTGSSVKLEYSVSIKDANGNLCFYSDYALMKDDFQEGHNYNDYWYWTNTVMSLNGKKIPTGNLQVIVSIRVAANGTDGAGEADTIKLNTTVIPETPGDCILRR